MKSAKRSASLPLSLANTVSTKQNAECNETNEEWLLPLGNAKDIVLIPHEGMHAERKRKIMIWHGKFKNVKY